MRGRSRQDPWSEDPDPRIRVLIECEPESSAAIAAAIELQGYSVRTCEGPRHRGCDLLADGACALVDRADVVVNLLDETLNGARIRDAVAATRRPPALVAELTPAETRRAKSKTTGVPAGTTSRITVLQPPVNTKKLIAAIEEALVNQNRTVPIWGDGFC